MKIHLLTLVILLSAHLCMAQFPFRLPTPPRINFGRFQPIINSLFSRPSRFRNFRRPQQFTNRPPTFLHRPTQTNPSGPPQFPNRPQQFSNRPPPPPPRQQLHQFQIVPPRPIEESFNQNFLSSPVSPLTALPPPSPPHLAFTSNHRDQGFGDLKPESLMPGHSLQKGTKQLISHDISNHIDEEPQKFEPLKFSQPQHSRPISFSHVTNQLPLHQEPLVQKLEPIHQTQNFRPTSDFHPTSGRFQSNNQPSHPISGFHRLPSTPEPNSPISNPDALRPQTIFKSLGNSVSSTQDTKVKRPNFKNETIKGMKPPPVLSSSFKPVPVTSDPIIASNLLSSSPELNLILKNDFNNLAANPVPPLNAGILPLANEKPQEPQRFPPFN